jgi:hypothetical protein
MRKANSLISYSRNSALASLLFVLATPSWAFPSAQQAAAPAVRDTPARDAAPDERNTARISGRVTSLDGGRPLRRARIQISGPGLFPARAISTNSDGRFEIRDLPAGRFTLRAERSGYLPLAYGQRRPGEAGTPLELAAQQSAENIDFALPRMGVINGRVADEFGEPMADVNMWVMRMLYYQGERRLVPTGAIGSHTSTDENGMYRLIALPPGDYVVMGHTRETWPHDTNPNETLSYAYSYYPGTSVATAAQRVKVAMGQEVRGIDFSLVPGRTSRVSGTVMTAGGAPVAGESVNLALDFTGPDGGSIFPSTNVARTGADGTFTIANVLSGEYRLVVRASAVGDQPAQEAQETLQVTGSDIDGLVIVTGAGGTLRGQVETDDGSPLPANVDGLSVRPRLLTPFRRLMGTWTSGNGRVDKSGAFELKHVCGPLRLAVEALSGDWTLKSVLLDRRDLADEPIDVAHGATVTGLRVVLTRTPTSLRGAVTDEKQKPADGTVVIFPEDRAHWRGQSRRVRAARPDQRGAYSFKGLPAGNYLVVAVDYVEDGQWGDPEFLDGLKPHAARVALADAESKTMDLVLRK